MAQALAGPDWGRVSSNQVKTAPEYDPLITMTRDCETALFGHYERTVTDLGITLGHFLRGLSVDWRRVRLQALLVSRFLVGATGGAAAWLHSSFSALWLPVLICLGLAAAHLICLTRRSEPL